MAVKQTVEEAVDNVVGVMTVLLLLAFLIPVALDQFNSVTTTNWGSNTVAIWENLPVIALVGVLLGIIYMAVIR